MMGTWWKRCDRRTDRQTDRRTYRRTDWTIHRAAWSQLKIGKGNTLVGSAIHCVLVIVLFGLNPIPWYLRLIRNQFPRIRERRILIFILQMFLTLLLPHSLTILLCHGRARKVYIRLNLMKFSGRIFYDFLHCYQKKTGMGILGFDRKLIKIAGQHIVDSLLYIINDSLSNGTFPDEWKLARVTPVFKNNGDVDVMSNYRPISVIGYIAKMVGNWRDPSSLDIWKGILSSHPTSLHT